MPIRYPALTNCRCFVRLYQCVGAVYRRGEEGVNHGKRANTAVMPITHQRASMTVPPGDQYRFHHCPLPERHVVLLFCHSYTCSEFNACAHWRADLQVMCTPLQTFPGFCDTDRGFTFVIPVTKQHHFAAHLRCHSHKRSIWRFSMVKIRS